jgi:hypothetical protein
MLDSSSFQALGEFPRRLEQLFHQVPAALRQWAPASWEGIPSEFFTAHEQVCHLRDIEIDGYQVRFRRMLDETHPVLPSLDSYALARERDYPRAVADEALGAFRAARARTLELLRGLDEAQWRRRGEYEDGPVTTLGLAHYLCSHDQQHLAGLHWLLARISGA